MATDAQKPASGARAGQQTTTTSVNKPEKNSYNVPVLLTVVIGLMALAAGIGESVMTDLVRADSS
jgi:hypothetical protein